MLGTGPGTGDTEMNQIAITLKELYGDKVYSKHKRK